jgi:hypothetical protein
MAYRELRCTVLPIALLATVLNAATRIPHWKSIFGALTLCALARRMRAPD